MNVMDILKSYAERPTDTQQDFDEVARLVPADALGGGIADAMRSDATPDFGSMAASLFGGSNPQQRSGMLGQLIRSLGPALLSTVAGGALGRALQGRASDNAAPADLTEVTPEQVREIATAAQKQDPTVLDRVGRIGVPGSQRHDASMPSLISAISSALRAASCVPRTPKSIGDWRHLGNISSCSSLTWWSTYSPSTVTLAS